MIFSFAMMAVSGVIYFYQTKESAHSGVLAHSISAIGDLQVALGLIDQNLSDLKGQMHGPFSIAIDPAKEREQSEKRILESTTPTWISSRQFDGKSLFYFTHLQQYSCAIEKAVYAYDNDRDLNQTLPLQACGHSKQQTALLSLQAPEDTSYMAVQLFYKDHTTSKVHKFMMKGFPKGVPIEQ